MTFGWVGAVKKFNEKEKERSVPVGDDPSVRAMAGYKEARVVSLHDGVSTLYDLTKDTYARFGTRKAMGVREFKGWKSPKVKHFGDTKWYSYAEVGEMAAKFGAALRKEGLVPAPETTTLDKVKTPCALAIFENTCPEWMISALGAFSQSVIVTTIYATLGMDAVVDAINDVSIQVLVCNKLSLAKVASRKKEMKCLKVVVYTNDLVPPDDTTEIPPISGVKLVVDTS